MTETGLQGGTLDKSEAHEPVDIGQKPGGWFTGVKARALRNIAAWALGALIAKYQNNIYYVSIAPILQTLAKLLRDKYPGEWEFLPF